MAITSIKHTGDKDRSVPVGSLNVGDTFLYGNRVGIIILYRGNELPIDLSNSIAFSRDTRSEEGYSTLIPPETRVLPIEAELTYNT